MDDAGALREAKRALRAEARARRDAIPQDTRALASREIAARVTRFLPAAPCLALYAAIGSEVDLAALASMAEARGLVTCYPRVEGERIVFRRATRAELSPGTWGIPEPPPDAPEAAPGVILVPGLAFDRSRRRLGYGRGFYDRALPAAAPALAIGVAFEAQLVVAVPAGPDDTGVDVLITEHSVLR